MLVVWTLDRLRRNLAHLVNTVQHLYAVRSETRHEHLAELRGLYGFRSFWGGAARELADRLREEAEQAQSNEDLVRRFVEACRRARTILPATTTIGRLCADALVDAERRIEGRIAERVPPGHRRDLEHLLEETADAGVTRFVWLRQFEPGSNSAEANRLLDRLDHLRRLDVPEGLSPTLQMATEKGTTVAT